MLPGHVLAGNHIWLYLIKLAQQRLPGPTERSVRSYIFSNTTSHSEKNVEMFFEHHLDWTHFFPKIYLCPCEGTGKPGKVQVVLIIQLLFLQNNFFSKARHK